MREIGKVILTGLFFVFVTSSGCSSAEPVARAERTMKKTTETREEVGKMLRTLEQADVPSRLDLMEKLNSVDAAKFAPEFIHALVSSSPVVREVACKKLRHSDFRDALNPLIKILKSDPDASVRRSAAVALGSFKSAGTTRALLEAMQADDAPEVRRFAVLSLGELKASAAAVPLAKQLAAEDANSSVIGAIIRTLVEIRNNAVVPYLVQYFQRSSDPAALKALGDLGGPEAAEFLISTLRANGPAQSKLPIPASLLRVNKRPVDQFLIGQAKTNEQAAVRSAIYRAAKDASLPKERRGAFVKAAAESLGQDQAAEVRKAAQDLIQYATDNP